MEFREYPARHQGVDIRQLRAPGVKHKLWSRTVQSKYNEFFHSLFPTAAGPGDAPWSQVPDRGHPLSERLSLKPAA